MKRCPNCGESMESRFCMHCGYDSTEAPSSETAVTQDLQSVSEVKQKPITVAPPQNHYNLPRINQKNKWTAFLLCLFLGFLGAHKFYERKYGMGLLYLLTFGLAGWGWLIDLIVLLGKPNPYYV